MFSPLVSRVCLLECSVSRKTGGRSSPSAAVLAGDCELPAVGVAVSKGRLPPLAVTWTAWAALTPRVLSGVLKQQFPWKCPDSGNTAAVQILKRHSASYACGLVFPHTVKPVAADTANISTNTNRICHGR